MSMSVNTLASRIRFSICGHFLVSRICDAGCSERCFKCAKFNTLIIRYHKKCCCIKTFGQWPWKLESVKECVTTHRTNAIALKINGAESVLTYKRQQGGEKMLYFPVCKLV